MPLPIIVQLATCVAAIAAVYFDKESGFAYVAAGAAIVTTALSIAMTIKDERHSAFIANALSNLVRAVQPSEYIREAIFARIRNLASAEGLPWNKTSHFGDKFVLTFSRDASGQTSAMVVVTPKDLTELSLSDEDLLDDNISKRLLDRWGSDDLVTDWNLIVERIKEIAWATFADHLNRAFTLKVWANVDTKYVAVGPPDCPDDTPPDRRAQFPEQRLRELLTTPPMFRSHQISVECAALVRKAT